MRGIIEVDFLTKLIVDLKASESSVLLLAGVQGGAMLDERNDSGSKPSNVVLSFAGLTAGARVMVSSLVITPVLVHTLG